MSIILIVEDHPTNRKLLRDVLKRAGHQVLEASCADEGLPLVRERRPDLVVMDIQLPGTDGLEAARILKEDQATCSIPVLALTAHAMPGDEERFIRGGCDAYLPKPLRYAELLKLVEQLIGDEEVEHEQ